MRPLLGKKNSMALTTQVSRKTTVMSERVFKRWDYLIFAVLTGMILCSFAYFLVYWFSLRDWIYFPIPFTIMTLGLNMLGSFEDPRIGYVQAAQVYYNQKATFIARGAAEDSYAFYGPIQMISYA